MKLSGMASVLGLSLILAVAGIACEDDNTPPKRDGGGTDAGDAARDSSPGTDGSSDRTPDGAAPDLVPDGPGGSPDADRPADLGPTPDVVPPDTTPPDAAPDTAPVTSDAGIVAVETCDQVVCPALFDLAEMCDGGNEDCTVNITATNPNEVRTICFANGVKKVATDTEPSEGVDVTTLLVTKPGGTPCYNLEVTIPPDNGPVVWVFKTPAGVELGRTVIDSMSDTTIFTCAATGIRYDINGAGCPGMEGEGSTCTDSASATCP